MKLYMVVRVLDMTKVIGDQGDRGEQSDQDDQDDQVIKGDQGG